MKTATPISPKASSSRDALLTTQDVAALLRVHPKQVYRLLKRGLPAVRVGDEWRFDRVEVLQWAAAGSSARGSDAALGRVAGAGLAPSVPGSSTPPLLAANGDCAVELVLGELRHGGGPLLGFVLADHAGASELLASGSVLVAGQHGGAAVPAGCKWARLHLMTRELGLCARARSRRRFQNDLMGRRIASRPPTAGIRRRLDSELCRAGVDLEGVYRHAVELDSHRAVVLCVSSGQADFGITTHAWAAAAGLAFQPFGSESYELVVNADQLGDARVVALMELLQSVRLRRRLRDEFGYGISKTGELRVG